MIGLPDKIFFCGAPGSRWSGVAQEIEKHPAIDISDRTPERKYTHHDFGGHIGAYFGTGMEFPADLDYDNLCSPYKGYGIPLLKSHEWCYKFDEIIEKFPKDWITVVYRNNRKCYNWWKEAGGWDITYPNYDWYEDDYVMIEKIQAQNKLIVDFVERFGLQWTHKDDISIATYKP